MSTTTFQTITQFDDCFKGVAKFSSDRSACPFFCVLTAQNFLNNSILDKKQHEGAIYDAVSSYIVANPPKYLGFEELIRYVSVSGSNIEILATTPELVMTDVIGFNSFFPDLKVNYCTIFLKNSNFFCVLVKYGDGNGDVTYAVRDCHQDTQTDFNNFEALKEYLNNTYRFNVATVVDGVPIPEFDNIEFAVISEPICALF